MSASEIPATIKDLLNVATRTGLADAADILALAVTHGADSDALRFELCERAAAPARICTRAGREIYAAIAAANDAYRDSLRAD